MSQALVELIQQNFALDLISTHAHRGDETVVLRPEAWFKVHQFLRDDPRSRTNMLTDLTAVDYPNREPRFEVVSHLCSLTLGHRLRVKTLVGDTEGEDARVATLTALWASANWLEREAFDMMGIHFEGHPDLRRILLYPEFEGHPLRKDYPADRTQPLVAFRETGENEKVAPFGPDEGMSFGRQDFMKTEGETES